MSTKVFGVKIILRDKYDPVTEDATIGLYNVASGNSEFRWIQNSITGVTTWCSTMLLANGIGTFGKSIDLVAGGNVESAGESTKIGVKNTSQFSDLILEKSVYINGCICEIYLFTNSTPVLKWSGVCQQPTWDSKKYSIPAKGSQAKRVSNLATYMGDVNAPSSLKGKPLPLIFGRNKYSLFYKAIDERRIIGRSGFTPSGATSYYVLSSSGDPVVYYSVVLGSSRWLHDDGSGCIEDLNGKYIRVVSGGSAAGTDLTGKIRKMRIAGLPTFPVDYTDSEYYRAVQLSIDSPFDEVLSGASGGKGVNNAWVEFVDLDAQFKSDAWPGYSFLDIDDLNVAASASPFLYNEDGTVDVTTGNPYEKIRQEEAAYRGISDYCFSEVGANKNNLKINLEHFNVDVSEAVSTIIKPVSNLIMYTGNLADIGKDAADYAAWDRYVHQGNGLHISGDHFWITDKTYNVSVSQASVSDKSRVTNSYADLVVNNTSSHRSFYMMAFCVYLPVIADDMKFDSVHLMIDAEARLSGPGSPTSGLYIRTIKFGGYAGQGIQASLESKFDCHTGIGIGEVAYVKDMPDFYYNQVIDNNNAFYVENAETESMSTINGYKRFELDGIDSVSKYRALTSIVIGFFAAVEHGSTHKATIRELGIAFVSKNSIKEKIYVPHAGRIFNNTFGGRRSASDLITTPGDVLEHIDRLQDYTDVSEQPSAGWGKAYAANPLLATVSFDALDYTDLAFYNVAAQIENPDDMYTDKLKRSICRDFFLASYVDKNGRESVKKVTYYNESPVATITFGDITDRSRISITEAPPERIFSEPFVKFDKDPASGNYTGLLKVTNSAASVYNAAYVSGVGEEYWDRCHSLYNKIGVVNKPPSDLTELTFANGEYAALIAERYLSNWIDWMVNPIISFPIHYNTFEQLNLDLCDLININLPHQTDGENVASLITGFSIDPNPPYDVEIEAIMFSQSIPAEYNIQETLLTVNDDSDWIEVADGNQPDIEEVM
jgi:hypothetical protein